MGQLRQIKQVRGQAAHQLAGAVLVIEIKAQLLHMPEQIPADICLHPNAEGMAQVGHDIVQPRPQHIKGRHHRHDDEKDPEFLVGQQIIQGLAGHQREAHVNEGDAKGTANVNGKELFVVLEIAQKNRQGGFFLKILCGHIGYPPFLLAPIIHQFSLAATEILIYFVFCEKMCYNGKNCFL